MLTVQFLRPGGWVWVELAVLVVLLLLSAFMSGSEAAFFSLRPRDLDWLRDRQERTPACRRVLQMLDRQERLLATILIGNNFVNVGIVILSEFITNGLVDFSDSPVAGFVVKVVAITFMLLLFGEIMPKLLGAGFPLRYSVGAALPLYGLFVILKPFSGLLEWAAVRLNSRFQPEYTLSIDDLGQALEITNGHEPEERSILERIVHYGHVEAVEIMKPRLDVVAVEGSVDYNTLKSTALESGYSRLPVFEETLDSILGVLYMKDLLPHIDEPADYPWQRLLRPAYYVPENKKIKDLFAEFQKEHIHLAVVVDEYGGTCGIVTLEDILEEVFGEIGDESDGKEELFVRQDDGVYLFQAKVQLNDFGRILGLEEGYLDDVQGEAETLGGLILERLGRFPLKGETLVVKHLKLSVEEVTNRRIEQVRVEKVG